MIKFKTDREEVEFETLKKKNPLLIKIVEFIEKFVTATFKKDIVITSIFRSKKEQKEIYGFPKPSTHMEWRAVDIRSNIYSDVQCKQLKDAVNAAFTYDKKRPEMKVALWHQVNDNGYHFHLQTHPNTEALKNG